MTVPAACGGGDGAARLVPIEPSPRAVVVPGDQPSQRVTHPDPDTGRTVASHRFRHRPPSMAVTGSDLVVVNGFDDRISVLARKNLEAP